MKIYRDSSVLLAFISFAAIVFSAIADGSGTEDVVMILDVSPDDVVSGVETETTIKIVYNLVSHESGAIRVTANALAPNGDHIIASSGIRKGAGELELKAKFVPRYWSDTVSFGVNAALLVPAGDDLRTKSLSVDRVNLHVTPHETDGVESSFPSTLSTYVDGIRIISVTPDSFVEGVPQYITVKVSYELLSREEGEISLSVNGSRPASRRPIGSKRVGIGKGVVEIQTAFAAEKIAGLPLGRLLITLSEYPRGRRSRALAWDEETFGVD